MITPSHAFDASRIDRTHLDRAEESIDRLIDQASSFPIIVTRGYLEREAVSSLRIRDCFALAQRYRDAGWKINPASVGSFGGVLTIDGVAEPEASGSATPDDDVH